MQSLKGEEGTATFVAKAMEGYVQQSDSAGSKPTVRVGPGQHVHAPTDCMEQDSYHCLAQEVRSAFERQILSPPQFPRSQAVVEKVSPIGSIF